jgi:hypothetical protein
MKLTGAAEQLKMNDCYFDKKDWRSCKKEVRLHHRSVSICLQGLQHLQIQLFAAIRIYKLYEPC